MAGSGPAWAGPGGLGGAVTVMVCDGSPPIIARKCWRILPVCCRKTKKLSCTCTCASSQRRLLPPGRRPLPGGPGAGGGRWHPTRSHWPGGMILIMTRMTMILVRLGVVTCRIGHPSHRLRGPARPGPVTSTTTVTVTQAIVRLGYDTTVTRDVTVRLAGPPVD
jgi:hypothetical protein